ncbi:hypothetical protein [Maribacter antarcticus]|uniref:hypothetical protein n=1 Tax=Maribacter antarcticus TaxID=505250 RepID=UPI00047C7F8C|nr:hypothetical protein [Maribacter antarcticus]
MKKGVRKRAKNKIILETILVFFIAIAPFLYKIYDYFPINEDGTTSFFGMVVGANGFEDASTFIWFLASKIVPLYLLLFWFLTSRDWWYHIILIPIAMYSFQLFEVVFDSDLQIDTKNTLWLLPVCMVVIPFVYFIRVKLYDKHVHGIDLEAIDAELEELKSNKEIEQVSNLDIPADDLDGMNQESIAEELDRKLSTRNLEQAAKQFQLRLQNLLHFNNK